MERDPDIQFLGGRGWIVQEGETQPEIDDATLLINPYIGESLFEVRVYRVVADNNPIKVLAKHHKEDGLISFKVAVFEPDKSYVVLRAAHIPREKYQSFIDELETRTGTDSLELTNRVIGDGFLE